MKTFAVLLTLGVGIISTSASAQSPLAALADGQPWSIDGPMGGTMAMTLSPDGTGRIGSGFFGRNFSWTIDEDVLCLDGLPGAASGCMVLRPEGGGFAGQREDGTAFRIWR